MFFFLLAVSWQAHQIIPSKPWLFSIKVMLFKTRIHTFRSGTTTCRTQHPRIIHGNKLVHNEVKIFEKRNLLNYFSHRFVLLRDIHLERRLDRKHICSGDGSLDEESVSFRKQLCGWVTGCTQQTHGWGKDRSPGVQHSTRTWVLERYGVNKKHKSPFGREEEKIMALGNMSCIFPHASGRKEG